MGDTTINELLSGFLTFQKIGIFGRKQHNLAQNFTIWSFLSKYRAVTSFGALVVGWLLVLECGLLLW